MKNLYGYFIISIAISILNIIAQVEIIQIVRLACCVLNIIAIRIDKFVLYGLTLNKIILFLVGVLTQQNESIFQIILDDHFLPPQLNNRLLILLWKVVSGLASTLLVCLKYQNEDLITLPATVLIPLMYFLPQSQQLFEEYFSSKNEKEQLYSSPRPPITKEYFRIRSRVEEIEFNPMTLDQNNTLDINQLMRRIASSQDRQFVLQEISLFNEQVWKLRMNAMPIGICIISNEIKPKFMNNTLINMIKKNFIEQGDNSLEQIYSLFMNQLQFKRIDYVGPYDLPHSAIFKNERFHIKNQQQQGSSLFEDEQYCLKDLICKIEEGQLDRCLNDEEQIIELFSTFESPNNKRQVFFDCRVLFQEKQKIDYMVIIQDVTKQNELSKLEEKNKFKTKVVQSFSHELRTPLNSATIFLQTAIGDTKLDRLIKDQYLQPCLAALKLQNHLINDIIDFSQINAKLLDLKFSQFNLQRIINEITEQFKFQFQFKKIGLAFEISRPMSLLTQIKTDYQRLLQVLTNIIQNALTYSETGYVLVRIDSYDLNEIEFSIQDEGIGLTMKQLTSIRQIINQEQQTTTRSQQWQGFGLIICQMLLRYLSPINRNSVQIESDGQDAGTTVKFIISNHVSAQTQEQAYGQQSKKSFSRMRSMPTLRAEYGLLISVKSKSPSKILLSKTREQDECDLSSASIREISGKIHRYELKHCSIELLNQRKFSCVTPQQKSSIQRNTANKLSIRQSSQQLSFKETGSTLLCCNTILSVDDEVFNQKSLQLLLGQQGMNVDIVFNGRQALEKVQNPTKCCSTCPGYKMILMDCQMPIMDGWKTTGMLIQMMQNQQIPKIPIIGLTAFTSNEDMEKCKKAGMLHILHKPLDIQKFQFILTELRII
ncbi:unnamed protein product (macronuclear) [Paramecium tetraurelia]|uniref:Response regulatory domain-containing protein n=1 Tax=Paramecium tetraurelia TaxID=5888 RepID=A0E0L1_PARTE|nr:uncharacterized protein GSPATT00021996001 [Paramecium tetraurelia]CAK88828.1 unnamed protein product [Paramecium tetraurelia]|eukprot:XP_001456225.1 hypothetical protein (macronuclear) [Paramecium tetraurelia strain d4-2]